MWWCSDDIANGFTYFNFFLSNWQPAEKLSTNVRISKATYIQKKNIIQCVIVFGANFPKGVADYMLKLKLYNSILIFYIYSVIEVLHEMLYHMHLSLWNIFFLSRRRFYSIMKLANLSNFKSDVSCSSWLFLYLDDL